MIIPPKIRNIVSPIFGLGLNGPEHGRELNALNASEELNAISTPPSEPVGEPLSRSLKEHGVQKVYLISKDPIKHFTELLI